MPHSSANARAGAARKRARWVMPLLGAFVGAVLIVVLSLAAVWWMYTTSSGLQFLVLLNSRLNSALVLRDVSGSLRDGFTAGSLTLTTPTWSLRATDLAVEPREVRLRLRMFDFERVAADTVSVDWVASNEPAKAPDSLAFPIDLRIRNLIVKDLRFGERDAKPNIIGSVAAAARLNANEIVIESGAFEHGPSRVTLNGRIDALSPFALQARAQISSSMREHGVSAQLVASRTLLEALIEIKADAADARVVGTARVTPFAPVPLAQLTAEIAQFNPAAWIANVPPMQLSGRVDLQPVAGAAGFSVAGPFAIENLDPGPIDRQRLPVRLVRGSLVWSAETLTLALQRVEGTRGSANGDLTWSANKGVDAQLTLSQIDASTLHSSAVPTRIDGTLRYSLSNQTQRFTGTLRTQDAIGRGTIKPIEIAADFNLTLRHNVLDIDTTRLRIADGRAELAGRVELSGGYAARVKGSFDQLNLALLMKGMDTRLNGQVEIDARFRPAIAGRAAVVLVGSRLMGRALEGSATIELTDQRLAVDVDAKSQSARLRASGGLGSGRELTFDLSAPQLSEVVDRTSGALTARGTLRGEYAAPQLRMDATVTNLKLPNGQSIDSAIASLAAGVAGTAPLALSVQLSGHRAPNPDASLAGATLIARGTTAGHTIELIGATVSGQPVRLIASGGWAKPAGQDTGAWRGLVVAAESGRPLELRLREPTPLVISTSALTLGPARFEARHAQFDAVELQRDGARWRTVGTFDGFSPQAIDVSTRAPRRTRAAADARTPLTLRGRWEFNLTDTLAGIFVIERTAGDLFGGIDALNPIGISDLGAALSVVSNRVTGTAYVRGKALGRLDAAIDAYVDSSGGVQLAANRPFRIELDAVFPDLSWIGPLIGDRVQFEGSGSVKTSITGTPADPTASGPIRATGLRIAHIEQGFRLEDGTLDAQLDDGVLVVNELLFTGSPRVAPDEKRAAESVSFATPGRLRAEARVALRTLTGSVGIQADRLPVLQRRDRWMVASGTGGITLTPERAELYAKLKVDGAFIDFSKLRGARTLPSDVVVVRAQQPKKTDAPAIDVTLDVSGDLGPRFYIQGAGLDARLDGALEITGRPGQLLAEGNVRTRGGTYQGYGQRLQIERGILTFQGPIENPSLNVLAVRTGLPVEVGVSVGGTAARPIVRLYSEPAMTDVERLNWLVLGRPPSGDGGQERALLSAAASALLVGQDDTATFGLMRSFGIDEISLRPGQDSSSILPRETVAGTLRSATGTTATSDIVAIGKRLNDDLYLTFEQAISGATSFVALNYQINRRLSLIGRAGTTNALDLVYSIAFD